MSATATAPVRHGLNSTAVVLPHEDRKQYEALQRKFASEWRPATEYERELLGRMVDCWWRLQRAYRVEAEFLSQREQAIAERNEGVAGDAALAMMFSDPVESPKFRLFLRYLTSAEKAWAAAKKAFSECREERLRREREEDMLESMLEMAKERAEGKREFVSQTRQPEQRQTAAACDTITSMRP